MLPLLDVELALLPRPLLLLLVACCFCPPVLLPLELVSGSLPLSLSLPFFVVAFLLFFCRGQPAGQPASRPAAAGGGGGGSFRPLSANIMGRTGEEGRATVLELVG